MTITAGRPVVFDCDGDRLVSNLHAPTEPSSIGVIIVVGRPQFGVGGQRQFVVMARSLVAAGIRVFRFDYLGMGDSEGESRGFDTIDSDIRAAIDRFATHCEGLTRVVLSASAMRLPRPFCMRRMTRGFGRSS